MRAFNITIFTIIETDIFLFYDIFCLVFFRKEMFVPMTFFKAFIITVFTKILRGGNTGVVHLLKYILNEQIFPPFSTFFKKKICVDYFLFKKNQSIMLTTQKNKFFIKKKICKIPFWTF